MPQNSVTQAVAQVKHVLTQYDDILVLYITTFCVVNGGWSRWANGVCNVSCGGGTKTMTRQCTNPTPSCGGANCTGLQEYEKPCNTHCCPGIVYCMLLTHVYCMCL